MKLRYKLLELQRQRESLYSFLFDPGDTLTIDQNLKLIGEIARLQRQIEGIESMTLKEVNQEADENEISVPSASNAAQKAIAALKTRILPPTPYAFSTWKR